MNLASKFSKLEQYTAPPVCSHQTKYIQQEFTIKNSKLTMKPEISFNSTHNRTIVHGCSIELRTPSTLIILLHPCTIVNWPSLSHAYHLTGICLFASLSHLHSCQIIQIKTSIIIWSCSCRFCRAVPNPYTSALSLCRRVV